jgi:hypothetical protein
MASDQSLTATIESASLREPDSDGDTRLDGTLVLKSACEQCLELFMTKQVLLGHDGTVLATSKDEREDSLDVGDELKLDLDSGYLKASVFKDASSACIQVEVSGCSADYVQLKTVQLGDGEPGLYGWHQPINIGSDVVIESLAVSIGLVDDDGDVRIELRALVHNKSDQYVPRLSFKARAMAAGNREIDVSSTEEILRPEETKAVELSFYSIKQNRLRGLSISAEATVFTTLCKAKVESIIDTAQL